MLQKPIDFVSIYPINVKFQSPFPACLVDRVAISGSSLFGHMAFYASTVDFVESDAGQLASLCSWFLIK